MLQFPFLYKVAFLLIQKQWIQNHFILNYAIYLTDLQKPAALVPESSQMDKYIKSRYQASDRSGI